MAETEGDLRLAQSIDFFLQEDMGRTGKGKLVVVDGVEQGIGVFGVMALAGLLSQQQVGLDFVLSV